MKIYQIVKSWGDYYDGFRDKIIGTYLNKEKAERHFNHYETSLKRYEMRDMGCYACQKHYNWFYEYSEEDLFQGIKKEIGLSCPIAKLEEIRDSDGIMLSCNTYELIGSSDPDYWVWYELREYIAQE